MTVDILGHMRIYEKTKATYEQSAQELAEYYNASGTRQRHIDEALSLIKPNPAVLELGCGNGRDARYLTSLSDNYVGIDYSGPLLKIAKQAAPLGYFIHGDIVTTDYPAKRNIIFALASILHTSPYDIAKVMKKANDCLQSDGIFYISTKLGHGTVTKKDRFGERTYYLYAQNKLEQIAAPYFDTISSQTEQMHGSDWIELALRRR